MATKSTNKENTEVLTTISAKNSKGELVNINVPFDYKGELSSTCERLVINENDNLLLRVTSIFEVIEILENEDYGIENIHESTFFGQIYQEEMWDEDEEEYRKKSKEEVIKEILADFKKNGCVYRYVTSSGNFIDNAEVRFLPKGARVITTECAEIFYAKYAVGTNCFYHFNSSEDLKSSKIETIVVKHKSGYNSTTEYVMKDGKTVREDAILMKDKALEWVENRG